MEYTIRPYHPSDLPALYRICLLSGGEPSSRFNDPDLAGHLYAAPYAVLEPDCCFMLTQAQTPVGYVIGCKDTAAFFQTTEQVWFPHLRKRYPLRDDDSADAHLIRFIHDGFLGDDDLADYPAHLHIAIMPHAQKQGYGRQLIETFLNNLRTIGIPAVHLEVANSNTNAIGFYHKVGFHIIKEYKFATVFGMNL